MEIKNARGPAPAQVQQGQPTAADGRQYTTETASTPWNGGQLLKLVTQARADEERYRTLLANLPCVVYRCLNDELWTVEFISEGCERITGYPSSDFLHNDIRSLASIVAPADRNRVRQQINHAFSRRQSYRIEYRILHADGTERWVLEHGQAVEAENNGYSWRDCVFFDISAQKQAEEALFQSNQELKEDARLIGEFLANVSHEIRTPLSVILTIAESLQEGIYGPASNRQVEAISRMRRSGRHLLGLINDILDVAKVEVGKLTLHVTRLAVETLCTHCLQMVQDAAQAKGISVHYNNPDAAAFLWADEQRLRQILLNLLANAIKFTPEGGQVGIEVTVNGAEEVIHFTVWDSGIGIASADTQKLFRPFVQLDTKLSRQYEGTGLGLALVYHLVRLHNGGVFLETDVGKGSRFTVSFPWQEVAERGRSHLGTPAGVATAESSGAVQQAQPRILIVQEDTTETYRLITFLQAHGFQVVVAETQTEAVTLACEQQPNLIILDIAIPDFSIIECIHRLQSVVTSPDIPILVISTLTVPSHQAIWQRARIRTCLRKPISHSRLLALIKNYLTA
jgi:PAS domain S-box-containing protein